MTKLFRAVEKKLAQIITKTRPIGPEMYALFSTGPLGHDWERSQSGHVSLLDDPVGTATPLLTGGKWFIPTGPFSGTMFVCGWSMNKNNKEINQVNQGQETTGHSDPRAAICYLRCTLTEKEMPDLTDPHWTKQPPTGPPGTPHPEA